jgi:hypothetical protein
MPSRAFAHPVSRLLLLAATVASTVATSKAPVDWSLEDTVEPEKLVLGPGESVERRYAIDSKPEEATLNLVFEQLPPEGAITIVTRRNDEGEEVVTWRGRGGHWTTDPKVSGTGNTPSIVVRSTMSGEESATFFARWQNDGTAPITVTLTGKAMTAGYEADREGAYVNIYRLP